MSSDSPTTDDTELSISTESVTRTIIVDLEASKTKLDVVRDGIRAYQRVLDHMADVLPSYPEDEWEPLNTQMYHQAKRALPDDRDYKTTVALTAQKEVASAYKSWRECGKVGTHPRGDYGDGQYLCLHTDDGTIHRNDRGWGLKTRFISYNAVWFHIDEGVFQREFLERVTDEDDATTAGAVELRLDEDDRLTCHLSVSWPVEVYDPDAVGTTVGVDLNDHPLAVGAVVEDGTVEDVEFVPGREFRHYREQLKRKKEAVMADDNLEPAKTALTYRRYTDHVTHTASRRLVDLAAEHAPVVIALEDLAHYRETAKDPIHDWPFAQLQEQIAYKATERGLPAVFVDPQGTSVTCHRCGTADEASRERNDFVCTTCGYEVHADLNAAVNIAERCARGEQ